MLLIKVLIYTCNALILLVWHEEEHPSCQQYQTFSFVNMTEPVLTTDEWLIKEESSRCYLLHLNDFCGCNQDPGCAVHHTVGWSQT